MILPSVSVGGGLRYTSLCCLLCAHHSKTHWVEGQSDIPPHAYSDGLCLMAALQCLLTVLPSCAALKSVIPHCRQSTFDMLAFYPYPYPFLCPLALISLINIIPLSVFLSSPPLPSPLPSPFPSSPPLPSPLVSSYPIPPVLSSGPGSVSPSLLIFCVPI